MKPTMKGFCFGDPFSFIEARLFVVSCRTIFVRELESIPPWHYTCCSVGYSPSLKVLESL